VAFKQRGIEQFSEGLNNSLKRGGIEQFSYRHLSEEGLNNSHIEFLKRGIKVFKQGGIKQYMRVAFKQRGNP
jgi:hypothetical protein